MAAIFISHSSDDGAQALALKEMLTKIGFDNVFLDFDKHQGIPLGSNWERKLYYELERCHAVLLVLTKNWLASKWCFAEFAQARAMGKTVYVVLENPAGKPDEIAKDIQVCDLVTNREIGLRRLHDELENALLVAQAGFAFDERTRAPYPGLNAFEEQDAAVFFGRDQEISAILERTKSERGRSKKALVLLGGSGAGKSSLLKAGALPRLRRERDVDGRPIHLVALTRPGEAPLRATLEALRTLDPSLMLADLAAAVNPRAARELIDRLRTRAGAPQARLVLAIDQAEETFASAPQEREPFLALLTALVDGDNPARLLLSMRADHIESAQRIAGLADALDFYAVKPMPLDRLGEIVRGPAKRVDIVVEDELIEAIRADAATEDALPLVAFVLRELYERYGRRSRRLEKAHYQAMRLEDLSPLESAVRRRAEETIGGATEAELDALREAFAPGLVRLDEERGVFARRDARLFDLPPAARALIEKLIDARLLVKRADDDGAHVEVAHEALFRVWPKLAEWLARDRDLLIRFQGVRRAAAEWSGHDRQDAWLAHRGLRLEEAEGLSQRSDIAARFDAVDRDYLAECRKREDAAIAGEARRRREREEEQARRLEDAEALAAANRRWAQAISVGLVVALALAIVAMWFGYSARQQKAIAENETTIAEQQKAEAKVQRDAAEAARGVAEAAKTAADRQRDIANATQSRLLATRSGLVLKDGDAVSAALLALEALPQNASDPRPYSPEAELALFQAVGQIRERFALEQPTLGPSAYDYRSGPNVKFSPDGLRVVAVMADGAAKLWDATNGTLVATLAPPGAKLVEASFSADGALLLTRAGPQGPVADAEPPKPGEDQAIRVWDGRTGVPIATPAGVGEWPTAAAFTPGGDKVAAAFAKAGIRLWAALSGRQTLAVDGARASLAPGAFNASAQLLAVTTARGAEVFDFATGRKVASVAGPSEPLSEALLAGDGATIWLASEARVQFWRFKTDAAPTTLFQRTNDQSTVRAFRLSHNGALAAAYLETGGRTDKILVWDARSGSSMPVAAQGDVELSLGFLDLSFSPNDSALLVEQRSQADYIPNPPLLAPIRPNGAVRELGGFDDWVDAAGFSGDGALVAVVSDDGSLRAFDGASGAPYWRIKSDAGFGSVAFAPNSRTFATTQRDGAVRLWGIDPIESGPDFGPCSDFVFDEQRGVGALVAGGAIRLIDVRNGRELGAIKTDAKPADSQKLAFSGDGSKLFQVDDDKTLVWTVDDPTSAATIPFAIDLDSIAFDGSTAAKFDAVRAKLEIWRAGGVRTTLPIAVDGYPHFLINAGGARLLVYTMSHEWLIDIASGRSIQDGAIDDYATPRLSSDGARLVVFRGGKAVVADTTTGQEAFSVPVEGSEYSFAVSKDARLAAAVEDGALVVRSVDAKAATRLEGSRIDDSSNWDGFAFSDDGALFAATRNGDANVWRTSTGKLVARLGLGDNGGALEENGVIVNASRKRAATIGAHVAGGRSFPGEMAIKIWSLQSQATTAVIDRASNEMSAGPHRQASAVDHDLSHVFACMEASSPDAKNDVDPGSGADGRWRLLTLYDDFLALRARAESLVPNCLDAKGRASYGLDPAPPAWCVTSRKWPYDNDDWRLWQAWRQRQPETPPLPASPEWASWRQTHPAPP